MPKAFAITAHLPKHVASAMPMELRQHWLQVHYHYGDRERTPVVGVPYHLRSQANPDIVFRGKTDDLGRIFIDQASASHYDLTLNPDPDNTTITQISDAIKQLRLDLANIVIQLQQAPSSIAACPPAITAMWHEWLDTPGIFPDSVTPWIQALQESDNNAELSPAALLTLRESLLILSSQASLHTLLSQFIQQAGDHCALAVLTHILCKALSVAAPAVAFSNVVELLCNAAADHLSQLCSALRHRITCNYARVSVNQRHEVKLKPQGMGALAINHQHESAAMNVLTFTELLPEHNRLDGAGAGSSDIVWQGEDFCLPGSFPLRWIRHYHGSCQSNAGMGQGWSHPLSTQLYIHQGGAWVIHQGVTAELGVPDIGCFTSHGQQRLWLYRDSQSRWLLKPQDNPVMTFVGEQTCRLERITHCPGHFWQCNYAPGDQTLRSLHNESGDSLIFSYQQQRLEQIVYSPAQQPSQRLVDYHYDDIGQLIGCRTYSSTCTQYRYTNGTLAAIIDNNSAKAVLTAHTSNAWKESFSAGDEDNSDTGSLASFTNDGHQRVLLTTSRSGEQFRYYMDGYGKLMTFLDPSGGGYNLLYNQQQLPVGFCDALGNSWECDYFASGLIREIRFPSGLNYRYHYQGSSLPTMITINQQLQRHLEWGEQGQLLRDSEPPAERLSSPERREDQDAVIHPVPKLPNQTDDNPTIDHRDTMGRLLQREFSNGARINCSYNRNGQLTEVMTPQSCWQIHYDSDGRVEDPTQDPTALMAHLDPAFRAVNALPDIGPVDIPYLTVSTPYCIWHLKRRELLFNAFCHEGHQDALFSLRLWQALQQKSWLPFIRNS